MLDPAVARAGQAEIRDRLRPGGNSDGFGVPAVRGEALNRRLQTRASAAIATGTVWTPIWTLIPPVSCVSCVSWVYSVNAAETHETIYRESGMRYHHSSPGPLRGVRPARLTVVPSSM